MADFVFPTEALVRLERCVLRPLHASDLEPMCLAADQPGVATYMTDGFPKPYTRQAGLDWLRFCGVKGLPGPPDDASKMENPQKDAPSQEPAKSGPPKPMPEMHLAICLLDGTFVGGIGLRHIGGDATNRFTREIGYWISPPFWGRGLATEATAGLSRWALTTPGSGPEGQPLRRLEAGVFAGNTASMKVLERAGYVREGVRRQAVIKDGLMYDVIIYGLVLSDLEKVKT